MQEKQKGVKVMTTYKEYCEACKVLKVNPENSLDAIRREFRKKARQCHSDMTKSTETDELLKKLTNAFAIVTKYKLENADKNSNAKDTNNQTTTNLERLKKEQLEKINSFFDKPQGEKFLNSLYAEKAIEKINELTDLLLKYSEKIKRSISEENINNIYHAWTIHVKIYLDKVKKDYFEKNGILETEANWNDFCTFNEFIKELEKQTTIEKEIEKATEKYQLYVGYAEIENIVNTIKEEYKLKIQQNKKEKNKLFQQMHQEIEKRFILYYEDKAKWQELTTITLNDLTIEEGKSIMLLKNFLGTEHFKEKYLELISIKNKVDYKKKALEIQNMYLVLYEKAKKEIENVSFTASLNKVYKINKILEFVWRIIEKARNGWIEVECLNRLQEITFQDFSKDMEILCSFHSNISAKDVYVEKEEKEEEDADQIRWLQIENDWYYMYSFRPGCIPEIEKIKFDSMEKINKYYIPLVTFLEQAQPIFYFSSIGTTLYGYPKDNQRNYYCYLEDDEDMIISIQILPFQRIGVIRNFNKKYTKYKDKNVIIKTIIKQINEYQENALREELENILIRKR